MAHQGKQLKEAVSDYKSRVTGFAKAIGKSRQQVYDYFKMEVLDKQLRENAANVLGIPVDTLFTVTDAQKPASDGVGEIMMLLKQLAEVEREAKMAEREAKEAYKQLASVLREKIDKHEIKMDALTIFAVKHFAVLEKREIGQLADEFDATEDLVEGERSAEYRTALGN